MQALLACLHFPTSFTEEHICIEKMIIVVMEFRLKLVQNTSDSCFSKDISNTQGNGKFSL